MAYEEPASAAAIDDGEVSQSTNAYTVRTAFTSGNKEIDPETGLSMALVKAIKMRESLEKEARKKTQETMA